VIPGVGPATAERLRRMGVHTVAELETIGVHDLVRVLGQAHGSSLFALARADDDRGVISDRETKSVSVEDTFETDLVDPVLLATIVDRHARSVCARLRKAKLSGRTVTLKVRMHDFATLTRSATLAGPTDRPAAVSRLARTLLAELDTAGGVRLLGVGVSGLADWIQDDLFDDDSVEVDDAEVDAAVSTEEGRPRHGSGWAPGMDVEHVDYGPGWVWGSGLGRVTVRFETADTPPGPVRTFGSDDPLLTRRLVGGLVTVAPAELASDRTAGDLTAPLGGQPATLDTGANDTSSPGLS
jgi:DNA polymerase IV